MNLFTLRPLTPRHSNVLIRHPTHKSQIPTSQSAAAKPGPDPMDNTASDPNSTRPGPRTCRPAYFPGTRYLSTTPPEIAPWTTAQSPCRYTHLSCAHSDRKCGKQPVMLVSGAPGHPFVAPGAIGVRARSRRGKPVQNVIALLGVPEEITSPAIVVDRLSEFVSMAGFGGGHLCTSI